MGSLPWLKLHLIREAGLVAGLLRQSVLFHPVSRSVSSDRSSDLGPLARAGIPCRGPGGAGGGTASPVCPARP